MSKTLGLYLHVPFCLSKCTYCDFYSRPVCGEDVHAYATALAALLAACAPRVSETVDTVFFGGGTPSLLDARDMQTVLSAVRAFSLTQDCEISVEVNPATATQETLAAYRALGINRISIGMQSALREELSLLGRRHRHEDTEACVRAARGAGFDNLSLDLMYALPNQTADMWTESLRAALALEPEHLSLYALSLSEHVPLYDKHHLLPDDEVQSELYLLACRMLKDAGYDHYEISNFARTSRACRHNLRYWQRGEYLGFGPSASSFYQGRRYTAPADTDAVTDSNFDLLAELKREDVLSPSDVLEETLMLSLRLSSGLDVRSFSERLAQRDAFLSEIDTLVSHGFLTREGHRVFLTDKGFFVSNEIIARLSCKAGL